MWWQHGLPEEDGVFDERSTASGRVTRTLAVVAYPRISNLDEFQALKNMPGVRLKWVRSPAELAGLAPSDWIILPGSKHTSGDLTWLRSQELDAAIAQHAAQGGMLLGVCGGLQMLGEALIDPHDIDGNAPGLGLLPLVTVFETAKRVRRTQSRFAPTLVGPWAVLAGVPVAGYEIHQGQTTQHPAMAAKGDVAGVALPGGLGWHNGAGNVLGVYLHGLFEDAAVLQALFGTQAGQAVPTLELVFERMADFIEQHFEPGVLAGLLETPSGGQCDSDLRSCGSEKIDTAAGARQR
jgi:adenosylcobyric acid synthase